MEPQPSQLSATLVTASHPLTPGGLGEMVRLAAPAVAAFMTNVGMVFADTIMVAGVGRGAVGAVTTAAIFFHAVSAFCFGVVSAVVTFTSQSLSRGDPQDGARYAWQGVYLALAMGLVGFAAVPALPWLFALLGHDADTQAMEVAYTHYRAQSLAVLLVTASLNSFFQGLGRTKLIFAITVVANACNVALNWLLIFGVGPFPRMGVAGAGLATLLANVVSMMLFAIPFLTGRAARECRTRHAWRVSWQRIKGLLRIGVPTSWQWSLDVLAWALWHAWLVGRLGTIALDANAVVMELTQMAWFPMLGVGHAAATLTGFYLGRRQTDAARRAGRSGVILATLYMSVLSVVMFVFAERFVGFFLILQTGDGAGADTLPQVVALGATAMRIAAVWQIFDGTCIALMGTLRGGGDTLWPAVVQQLLTWGLFLPLAWILCFKVGLGMPGAWVAGVVHLALLSAVMFYRYRGDAWTRKNIFRDRTDLGAA
ncbi:MAG TPA: MATE family efflux transporter [Phycisphaerae bacterium]|nr:MATE family efflux transporter [Phycisphaerae bacterium]HOI54502.1 MATE family efflux transporter [Phycisphaerae bacterium]